MVLTRVHVGNVTKCFVNAFTILYNRLSVYREQVFSQHYFIYPSQLFLSFFVKNMVYDIKSAPGNIII